MSSTGQDKDRPNGAPDRRGGQGNRGYHRDDRRGENRGNREGNRDGFHSEYRGNRDGNRDGSRGENRGNREGYRDGSRGENRGNREGNRDGYHGENRGNRDGFRGDNRGQRGGYNRDCAGHPAAQKRTARDAALRALQDVVRNDAYAAQALDRALTDCRLKPEDRRLAASIFYFAVENRLYIQSALSPFLEQTPEMVVLDILHIAAAQLLFMDRVPDHAVVDEAVKQARAMRREGFSGLVNAVLRALIRARDAGEVCLPDREADPQAWLSVRYSIAPPIARRLIDVYGFDEAERIAAWTPDRRVQSIRPNRARMDDAAFEAYLNAQGLAWRRGVAQDAYLIEDGGSLAEGEGFRHGLYSIQGQSAMLAAQAVQAAPGMQILDACAAPGGKTCMMAERMGGAGRVYAWDVHAHRVELIYAAARRLGLENIRPSEHDARKPLESLNLAMDAVLVDAPCSGLGVIAEKPDIKYRQTDETLSALPALQDQILDACAQAVRVGGLLVYATCTLLPEENADAVARFLKAHPQFEPDGDDGWLPEALRPHFAGGMIQILPQRDGLDGFFIARMRRKGV